MKMTLNTVGVLFNVFPFPIFHREFSLYRDILVEAVNGTNIFLIVVTYKTFDGQVFKNVKTFESCIMYCEFMKVRLSILSIIVISTPSSSCFTTEKFFSNSIKNFANKNQFLLLFALLLKQHWSFHNHG